MAPNPISTPKCQSIDSFPYLPVDEPETNPTTAAPKDAAAPKDTPTPTRHRSKDRLVKPPRHHAHARAKLNAALARGAETTPSWLQPHPEDFTSTKMTPSAKMSPNPAYENDPKILKYQWNDPLNRYQVTKYAKGVRYNENGIPLRGVTVKRHGIERPLSQAITALKNDIKIKLKAFAIYEKTPFGHKSAKSANAETKIKAALYQCLQGVRIAQAILDTGKAAAAKRVFSQTAKSFDKTQTQIAKAIQGLRADGHEAIFALRILQTTGKLAELALMLTGAGAAMKTATTLVRSAGGSAAAATTAGVLAGASAKTTYQTVSEIHDHLLAHPRQPLDWSAISAHATQNLFWNSLSGSLSSSLEKGLLETVGPQASAATRKAVKLTSHAAGEAATLLARLTKMSIEHAMHKGTHESAEHIAEKVLHKSDDTLTKLFGKEHSKHIDKELKTIIVSVLLHALH